jgi:hypothetical protein
MMRISANDVTSNDRTASRDAARDRAMDDTVADDAATMMNRARMGWDITRIKNVRCRGDHSARRYRHRRRRSCIRCGESQK